jgi:ADP-L-glycero-D-manno-heptose 6-epimerase
MDNSSTIVVTGAAGFIGSCLVEFLNQQGYFSLILVDDFSRKDKTANWENKKYSQKIERSVFFEWLEKEKPVIGFVYHLGARTDTTEFDYSVHEELNVNYSKKIWIYCSQNNIPLVYASSAATYGNGDLGYSDDENIIPKLNPLNPYGVSKNEFDKWALKQESAPPAFAGLKFFNVYGPNEFHKGRMASVIFHAFHQISENGYVKLFKSHKPEFRDGEQLRDFIYVKDVLKICFWFQECWQKNRATFISGIYNVGTGQARSFIDLVSATFDGMYLPVNIQFIDMPIDIQNTYQYYTQAEMQKIGNAGYSSDFYSLEEGISEYVTRFLLRNQYY